MTEYCEHCRSFFSKGYTICERCGKEYIKNQEFYNYMYRNKVKRFLDLEEKIMGAKSW